MGSESDSEEEVDGVVSGESYVHLHFYYYYL